MQRIFQAFEFDLACTYANKKFAYFLFCGNNGTLMWFIADSLKQKELLEFTTTAANSIKIVIIIAQWQSF